MDPVESETGSWNQEHLVTESDTRPSGVSLRVNRVPLALSELPVQDDFNGSVTRGPAE